MIKNLLLIALAASALIFGLMAHDPVPELTSHPLYRAPALRWQVVTSSAHNAFHTWRKDSYIETVVGKDDKKYIIASLGVLCASIMGLLLYAGISLFEALLCSVIIPFLLFKFFGLDYVTISTLTWLPLTVLLFSALLNSYKPLITTLLLFCVSMRLAESANQLALLIQLAAFFIAVQNCKGRTAPSPVLLLFLFAPVLLTLLASPAPPLPSYPSGARVLAHISGPINQAFFGPSVPLAIVDTQVIRQSLLFPATLLLIFCAAQIFKQRGSVEGTSSGAALIFSSALFLDCILPEHLAQVMPLATIQRIVPHLIFFPLTLQIFGVTLLVCLTSLAKTRTYGSLAGLVICLALFAKSENSRYPDRNLSAAHKRIISSPSHAVEKALGPWIVDASPRIKSLASYSLRKYKPEILASHNNSEKLFQALTDKHARSRWSSDKGYQDGHEWLYILWQEPIELDGLELSTGKYDAEYPRGLQISYAMDCSKAPGDSSPLKDIAINLSEWTGPLRYTADGYPYFGPANDVKVYFPQKIRAKCLLIQQTGKARNVDWSVAELKIFSQKEVSIDHP